MKEFNRFYVMIVPVLMIMIASQQAWAAGNQHNRFATNASNAITPFLAVGGLSLMSDSDALKQGSKALAATGLLTVAMKSTFRQKRPISDSRTSFPSGHTSSAFAMATVVADYKPQYKWTAYGGAAIIGWSRVEVGAHRWRDVAAGAVLGYCTAKHFTNKRFEFSPEGISYKCKL